MTQVNQDTATDNGTDPTLADGAAPDVLTAKAAVEAAQDKKAGKTEAEIVAEAASKREKTAAAQAKVKTKYYKSVNGGILIDPDTQIVFNGEGGVKSKMTSWLEFQIANGKIAEDTDE